MSESSESMPVRYGDVVAGKYRIEQVLGAGGMGVVVAARHIELDELFAIKLMLPAALENTEAVERFMREARAAARLKSEHVARVHDVGRLETGAPYMVMEHLTGNDLKKVLTERGALPLADVVTYVLQACEAITEAHGLGIIHRDLKPANLFLAARPNGSPCVKVLDFGISKQNMPGGPGMDITKTASIMGSPFYMAPEQMRSTKTADARADVWALGVIIYELGTGAVPFPGETITEICAKVLSEEPPAPSAWRHDFPPALGAIIARCLAKHPSQRFSSVPELSAALLQFKTDADQRASDWGARVVRPAEPSSTVRVSDPWIALPPPQPLAPTQSTAALGPAFAALNAPRGSSPSFPAISSAQGAQPGISGTGTANSWAGGQTGPSESRRNLRVVAGLAVAGASVVVAIGLSALVLRGGAPASLPASGGDTARPAGPSAERAPESTSSPPPELSNAPSVQPSAPVAATAASATAALPTTAATAPQPLPSRPLDADPSAAKLPKARPSVGNSKDTPPPAAAQPKGAIPTPSNPSEKPASPPPTSTKPAAEGIF